MSGALIARGACYGCGNLFSFNAERVPSIPIDGTRRPICPVCVEAASEIRETNGLAAIVVLPGAYDGEKL